MNAKLVKARPKAVEHLPEWAKCCQESVDRYQGFGDMLVDLANTVSDPLQCSFCKSPHGVLLGVWAVSHGGYISLEALDLDEGPAA